jgi:hypothetical protein
MNAHAADSLGAGPLVAVERSRVLDSLIQVDLARSQLHK